MPHWLPRWFGLSLAAAIVSPALPSATSPLVSVVLPAWNAAHTLGAALQSLLDQRPTAHAPVPDFEVVVVDDGSSDDTPALLEHWRSAPLLGNRLKPLYLPHGGIVAALNAGLAVARGTLVARMDADDTAHPHRLASQAAHLCNNAALDLSATCVAFGGDPQMAHGFAHFVDWQNGLLSHEQISRARFRDTPVCHPSVMFRRQCVDKWGAYRHGDFAEDWEIWLRWLHQGAVMDKLPQQMLVWNDAPTRATRADRRYTREACDRLRAVWLARWLERNNPFHPHVWVVGGGRVARQRLAPLWRLGPIPAAYVDIDPRKIGNRIQGVAVVGRPALPPPGQCCILNALTAHGAAEEASQWLTETGHQPSQFLIV